MGIKKLAKKLNQGTTTYVKNYPDQVIFRRLLSYLIPYKKDVFLLIFLMIMTSVTQLAYPLGTTFILRAIQSIQESNSENTQLYLIGGGLFFTIFLNFLTKRAYQYNINKLSQVVMRDIRKDLFSKIQTLSLDFYSEIPAGKLMSRLTNDVGVIQSLISSSLIQVIGDIFTVVATISIMFYMSWKLSLSILLLAPFFIVIFYFFGMKSRKLWAKQRKTIAEITSILQESISGSRTIKAFVTEDQNIETFARANFADKKVSLEAAKVNAYMQPIVQFVMAIALSLVIFIGARLVRSGEFDFAYMIGYVVLATQFINPFNNIGNFYTNAQQSLAAGDRILLILDRKPTVQDSPDAIELPPVKGYIEYNNVNFRYVDDIDVLKDINLKTTPKQRYAFVGFTGAGKSTMISLLSRFYDPQEGEIIIDGYNIKNVTEESLRSQMGIVLQDTFLFSGTIMDNIRYGKLGASDEEVLEASKNVGAHQFIMNLPDGYKTNVRERGSLLSVGQRQLIAFARALLADPPILILDEATSSVDPYTELKIQEALEVLLDNRNSFIIAHRLSTILNADVICVMENGKIIQRGSHDELIAEGGLYKHLYEMQFKKPKEKEILSKES